MSGRVLVHQSFDFCENLIRSLFVLNRKSRMNLDTSRDIRKENRIESHEMQAQVCQDSQPVKYSVNRSCQSHRMGRTFRVGLYLGELLLPQTR